MQQPLGFVNSDTSSVCKLNKSIYGLKQAPGARLEWLTITLYKFGFQINKFDPSLCYTQHANLYNLYACICWWHHSHWKLVESHSKPSLSTPNQFSLKLLGTLDYFLSNEVSHYSNGDLFVRHSWLLIGQWSVSLLKWMSFLSQTKYIRDLLVKTNMIDAKMLSTLMVSNLKSTRKKGRLSVWSRLLYVSGRGLIICHNRYTWDQILCQ